MPAGAVEGAGVDESVGSSAGGSSLKRTSLCGTLVMRIFDVELKRSAERAVSLSDTYCSAAGDSTVCSA